MDSSAVTPSKVAAAVALLDSMTTEEIDMVKTQLLRLSNTRCHLLKLPGEIRNELYRLTTQVHIEFTMRGSALGSLVKILASSPLFQTCTQIRSECASLVRIAPFSVQIYDLPTRSFKNNVTLVRSLICKAHMEKVDAYILSKELPTPKRGYALARDCTRHNSSVGTISFRAETGLGHWVWAIDKERSSEAK